MDPHVIHQIVTCRKEFFKNFTRIRVFSAVGLHMLRQFLTARK